MQTNKLTIVPVALDPISDESPSITSLQNPSSASCIIKIANAEFFFFNGVDERIIETVMKELNYR